MSALEREARFENPNRPLVPLGRLRAVLAVRVTRLYQTRLRPVVFTADEMNLRQRVVDRPARLTPELDGAADLERASQDLLGALQLPGPDADLAKRRQRDAKAVG
jgi:hypothetical protein